MPLGFCRSIQMRVVLCLAAISPFLAAADPATAGHVLLKNGMRLNGRVEPVAGMTINTARTNSGGAVPVYEFRLIDDGIRRYFVASRQCEEVVIGGELESFERFEITQAVRGRDRFVQILGGVADVTPFSPEGRRTLTLKVEGGRTLEVVQGITEITPERILLKGLTHQWESGLSTASLPPDTLLAILHRAIDRDDARKRLSVVRFLIEAQQYQLAQRELVEIGAQFPELVRQTEDLAIELRQRQAQQVLDELTLRRLSGQHRLVYETLNRLPRQDVNSSVLQTVDQLRTEYEQALERAERAITLLGTWEAEVTDEDMRAQVSQLRSEVVRQISFETLRRLEPMLAADRDPQASAEEKLALGYSGWLVGAAQARESLSQALHYAEARRVMLEYLRTDNSVTQNVLVSQLHQIEGIGPEAVGHLLDELPPTIETAPLASGEVTEFEAPLAGGTTVKYAVQLPTEYSPHLNYPVIITLRDPGRSAAEQIEWWGGTAAQPGLAQRRGFIVVAPEYLAADATRYDYGMYGPRVIDATLLDLRRRFRVDSNRVFLTGHGVGATAAFDIGMSRPDQFAGVIPICGLCENLCQDYWDNGKQLSWYVISGELDGGLLEENAKIFNRMMRYGHDVIYAEFKGRGREHYYEEIFRLFDWMQQLTRTVPVAEFEAKVLRPSEAHWHWLAVDEWPVTMLNPPPGARRNPLVISGEITPGNSIRVRPGGRQASVWLGPDLIAFDKRLTIRVGSRTVYSQIPVMSLADCLEHQRLTADRQRRAWLRITF